MVPPKATWIALETTELGFEHYLAEKLHMTVARLRQEMSSAEYMRWSVYFGRKAQREQLASMRARGVSSE